jgi:hypothetical protein
MNKTFSIEEIEIFNKRRIRFIRETVILSITSVILCLIFGLFGYLPQLGGSERDCELLVLLWCRFNNAYYLVCIFCFAILNPWLNFKANMAENLETEKKYVNLINFSRLILVLLGIIGFIGTCCYYIISPSCSHLTLLNLVYIIIYSLFLLMLLCIFACPFILMLCMRKKNPNVDSTMEFWKQF